MDMESILEGLKRIGTSSDSPFAKVKALGNLVSSTHSDKQSVDAMLLDSQIPTGYNCFVCNNTAQYQVLAKEAIDNTAQIQDGLYVCHHHLLMKAVNPNRYGIRELK
jgi:bifunctional N-acetylglucosamine-1-phosphate-uridyltransferase/glucosamine-1-phosphate-acetyltransferase GlmU-like protein